MTGHRAPGRVPARDRARSGRGAAGGGRRRKRLLIAVGVLSLTATLMAAGCRDRESAGGSVDTSGATTTAGAATTTGAAIAVPAVLPITIGGERFDLEVAADHVSRNRGLMYRREIAGNGGMLFVFPDVIIRSFWMGWCLVDLDLIFLDDQGRITAMHRMKVEPVQKPGESEEDYRARMPGYDSRLPARFAIELPGGSLDRLDLEVGDAIGLDTVRLGQLVR